MTADGICLLHTGGTISMQPTTDGYAPAEGFFEKQVTGLIAQAGYHFLGCEIHSLQPLLDSVNVTPSDWLQMAEWIARHHNIYRGFVIVHGTDTMAYTASALAFLLRGLGKPVILTGSMVPLGEPDSDARDNLLGSLYCARHEMLAEVCIYFGGKLVRGCRATKISAWRKDAFDSPNAPLLGSGSPRPRLRRARLLSPPPPASGIQFPARAAVVGLVKVFPGMSAAMLEAALRPPLEGAVLETYGKGSISENIPGFINVLRQATGRGVVLVNVSQCCEKSPTPGWYQSGTALAEAGVLSGGDMTHEAALAKLFTLLSQDLPPEAIRRLISQDLCGELTLREETYP